MKDFIKVHGTGNDFVFLDLRAEVEPKLTARQAQFLCDRHFGIGADGILALVDERGGVPRMRIYNADGTVPEMCGNGLRCFARTLRDHFGYAANPLTVLTDAGEKACQLVGCGEETRVTIAMGPVFDASGTTLLAADPLWEAVELDGEEIRFVRADVGNPHAVCFGQFSRSRMEQVGPRLSTHPFFPAGTNVEFLNIVAPDAVELTVCERGVGFTLACGTGAVAAVGAAVACGFSPADEPVRVTLPGGTLQVTVAAAFHHSLLNGPAAEVYRGRIALSEDA